MKRTLAAAAAVLLAGGIGAGISTAANAAPAVPGRSPAHHASITLATIGTGYGTLDGRVRIDTTPADGGYEMVDPSHGDDTVCDLHGTTNGSCTVVVDADNVWNDPEQGVAVDAYYAAANVYDFYQDTEGRAGIFGDGRGVRIRVHYGNAYTNVFWDGRYLNIGGGAGTYGSLAELDVVGHELSHGVAQATANLGYSGDAGGINEANSDIFGTMIEFYADNANDPPDYTIGEKLDLNGDGTPLRYLYHPSLDGGSFDCWSPAVPQSDPHYSSGVGNHWFFLAAEGSGATPYGTSPTCNGSSVAGIGRAKAAHIWYRALSVYFTSHETYAQARQDTLRSATDLYGQCSPAYLGVRAAWSAVAVSGTDQPCPPRSTA